MILITKTSDQTRQRGHALSTCTICMYVCMYVCIFIKLHITAQSGPVIYSFYATACNPPGGYLSSMYVCMYVCCLKIFAVSHIQRIGCQPEKTTLHGAWPIPLVVF